ncbi:MAG: hypothetical protein A2293_10710 [Elusimicrobia bacterium RIFOXYB2_FULL_49_7]|nr:MAG: hypothetical protein A2293_10710 [Elusimicrobia bacterium RIFOXYB2_FULL_49_7]
MKYAIFAKGLIKRFGTVTALSGADLKVPTGSLYGLIGADGTGKTTLMRCLATLIDADSGEAAVLGWDVKKETASIRRRIGYMPQRFSLYEDLSVEENLLFFADVFNVTGEEREKRLARLLAFSRLAPFKGRRAGALSGGMKQKLALSCALIHTPELLILDEPTTGVDPVSRLEFWNILHELKGEGVSILVSTPYMEEADYCDDVTLFHNGQVLLSGKPDHLCSSYPHFLYRLEWASGADMRVLPNQWPLDIRLLYPAKGGVHCVSKLPEAQKEKLLALIQEKVPQLAAIEPVPATMEDLFFLHLAEVRS